ncbi:MAG: hypothetical protein IPO02_10695 [Bacteroidetes bacterium]|nr:hypothetical protein [Bacteroidota bacterium]
MKTVIFGEGKFVAINVEDPPGQIAVGLAVVERVWVVVVIPYRNGRSCCASIGGCCCYSIYHSNQWCAVCTAPDKAPGLYKV